MKVAFLKKYCLCAKIEGSIYWTFLCDFCPESGGLSMTGRYYNLLFFSEEQLSHWKDKHRASDKNEILLIDLIE